MRRVVRLNQPDFHPSVESFDLAAALANPASAPTLQALDTVRIFSRYDFQAPPDIWIGGEVRTPGKYRTAGEAHLRDAIYPCRRDDSGRFHGFRSAVS